MKWLLFLFFGTGVFPTASAQITAKFMTTGGSPIASANVLLVNSADSSLVKAALTDEQGACRITGIQPGRYRMRFSHVGYQPWDSREFGLADPRDSADLGTQTIKDESRQLGEVVVRAEKPLFQQQLYGTTVNVASSILSKGSSVLEVLEKSPGVIIDHHYNSISLNGKTGITVMIDDRLQHMSEGQLVTFLDGLSADEIEKIELLTTPPARYDAEGTAGIINIVLKKTKKKGTNGSLSLTGGYGWRGKAGTSLNLSHNTEKVDLHGSYAYAYNKTIGTLIASGNEIADVLGGPASFDYLGITQRSENSHNAILGVDARLNQTITIGAGISYNNSYSSSVAVNRDKYTLPPDSILLFNGTIDGHSLWTHTIASLYVEKKIRDGEKFNIDLDYLNYHNDAPTSVNSTFVDKDGNQTGTGSDSLFGPRQQGFANTTIRVGVAKFDYTKTLNEKIKLEAGIKGTYTGSTSLSGIESLVNGAWVSSLGATDFIHMKEGIGAAYASFNTQFDKSLSLVLGARYEYSDTHLDEGNTGTSIIDRRLGKLFPNIFLVKKLNEDMELQLSYTKRITRPSYNDLASFIVYNDPISVFTGNPLLKPMITNNIKLGFTIRKYSFSVLSGRDENPIIGYQITKNPSNGLVFISPQNAAYGDYLTFQTGLPLKINDWWEINLGFVGGWRRYRLEYTPQPAEKTYWAYSTNFSQSFRLPHSWSMEVSGFYNSPSYDGNGKDEGGGALNAGVKKELRNNKGNLQLSVTDIFSTLFYNDYIGVVTEDAFRTHAHVNYRTDSSKFPIIKLTWSWAFGSTSRTAIRQENGPKEERDRIR